MAIQIELTHGKVAIIDDDNWDLVSGFKWRAVKGHNTWYALATSRRDGGGHRAVLMHRLLLGLTDPTIKTDHRDGDGLNNQRENIRACSDAENGRNRRKNVNNSSGFKGARWHKGAGRWVAQIWFNGKQKYLGLYSTPQEAHAAYCAAAIELHGEFANFGMAGMEA